MTIFPAIDLRGGRCVRLLQGRADQETVYSENPGEVARQFRDAGAEWIHVVDLDGAFGGEPRNQAAVAAILESGLKVELGGGLRDAATVRRVIELGVSRAVIGTRACEQPEFIDELVGEHGKKIAAGIDANNGMVAVKGWVSTTGVSALDLAKRLDAAGVGAIITTDIATDGMLTGPNFTALEAMLAAVGCGVIASGGVSRREDVIKLAEIARQRPNLLGVIVGKAIYEQRVDLADLISIGR
jgi:phosphoribosylformimino-5-aminoimidazole carboxamide ribotide isomerase